MPIETNISYVICKFELLDECTYKIYKFEFTPTQYIKKQHDSWCKGSLVQKQDAHEPHRLPKLQL